MNNEILKEFNKLNSSLKDLLYAAKELEMNSDNTGEFLNQDLGLKIRSDLEHLWGLL